MHCRESCPHFCLLADWKTMKKTTHIFSLHGLPAVTAGAILTMILLLFFAAPVPAAEEPSMRVLLLNGAFTKIPQKDEKVEKLGHGRGKVFLGSAAYLGMIDVWKGTNGLYIVNTVSLEEYTMGVVSAEVGSSWDSEALKAQAVAARTYALYQKLNRIPGTVPYDLTSSVLHQVYKGGTIPESIRKAVRETKGEILTHDGRPILAYYHSTSCDITEESSEVFGKKYSYLQSVVTDCDLSPYSVWQKRFSADELKKSLGIDSVDNILIDSYTSTGRVKTLKITSNGKEGALFQTKDMRRLLGWERLPSTMITSITKNGDQFVFEGTGYGHGVGLCQWSTLKMAKEGMLYRDILSRFYPGTRIEIYGDR